MKWLLTFPQKNRWFCFDYYNIFPFKCVILIFYSSAIFFLRKVFKQHMISLKYLKQNVERFNQEPVLFEIFISHITVLRVIATISRPFMKLLIYLTNLHFGTQSQDVYHKLTEAIRTLQLRVTLLYLISVKCNHKMFKDLRPSD